MSRIVSRFPVWLYAAIIILPLGAVISTTFKTDAEIYQSPFGLPKSLTIHSYTTLLQHQSMGTYFQNSIIVTSCSVVFTLLFASFIAFTITQLTVRTGRFIFLLFAFGMMVPAQVSIIPLYQIVAALQLTNSLLGLIVVNIASTLPIAVFILTGFMKLLPRSLFEASIVDGANYWQMYIRIAVPLSAPSLASTGTFLFVMHWNDLLYPLLFITNDAMKTLPLALLGFQGEYLTNYPALFAGVILSSLPVIITYVLLQRYFVAGLTAGALK